MSIVKVQGNASGTGTFTVTSPNSNNTQTLTLPDATDTLAGIDATQTFTNKTLTTPTIATIKSASTSPTVFQNSSGTEIGTLCRAWVNFQGGNGNTAGTRNASFNVSSVTVNGTGNYTLNFTNAMPDANYAVSGSCLRGSVNDGLYIAVRYNSTPTTSACNVVAADGSGNSNNPTTAFVAIFR